MRKSVLSAALAAFVALTPSAMADVIVGTSVTLRTLDKVTAETKDFTVVIGETLAYGSLEVTPRHCEKTPPEAIPQTSVFLEISDKRLDGEGEQAESEEIFSGWMFAETPALNALEHRVYDVWLISCNT